MKIYFIVYVCPFSSHDVKECMARIQPLDYSEKVVRFIPVSFLALLYNMVVLTGAKTHLRNAFLYDVQIKIENRFEVVLLKLSSPTI